jgi:hypothetical protein
MAAHYKGLFSTDEFISVRLEADRLPKTNKRTKKRHVQQG